MLKHLTFEVTFPSTGRQFSGDHSFEEGLTTISGLNETGKSLRLEMVRFALFGSRALRATTSKYKDLKVQLDFVVKGSVYKIVRTLSKATLLNTDSNVIAVGTSAVNAKVAEIFGYGLDVFDASHSVNQGQIEQLGAMMPSERKKMVDSVIGLNVLDSLIDFAGKTASGFTKDADTLSQALTVPVEPAQPENYRCSTAVHLDVVRFQAMKSERDQILGQLKNEPVAPTFPEALDFIETAEELNLLLGRRQELTNSLTVLRAQHNAIKDPTYTAAQLDEIEKQIADFAEWQTEQQRFAKLPARPEPSMPLVRIQGQREYLAQFETWEAAVAKWNRHKTECPKCHHAWVEKMVKPADEMESPDFTKAELDDYEHRLKAWEGLLDYIPLQEPPTPPFGFQQLKWERDALVNVVKKQNLADNIAILAHALDETPDVTDKLDQRRAYDMRLALASRQQEIWLTFQTLKANLEHRLAELEFADEELVLVQTQERAAIVYETMLEKYNQDMVKANELAGKIAEARSKADAYAKAKKALVNLKALVKTHLVPSLNKVASVLLSQMTGGQRNSIVVNEDFDIKVDGQDIDELSGSAKAVANLSIRLGLGQVLTNRVFGVFMGDELDAAMDNDRAGFTAECLQGLTGKIPQVILVSHKKTGISDHTIELGEAA